MARLIMQEQAGEPRALDLHLGVNRIGRAPDNHFAIEHATISLLHCEVEFNGEGLMLRDLGSTNGTFVEGERIRQAQLQSGQRLRLGSVEMTVEIADAHVVIPEFRKPVAPPIIKTPTGKNVCLHHENHPAVWKCTRCGNLLCTPCIHRLRRRRGRTLYLCPDCSGPCDLLPEYAKTTKQSWFGLLRSAAKKTLATTLRITGRWKKS
jgi:pSer/pThr/pTyr-binding forkhead associated (FHA) protein